MSADDLADDNARQPVVVGKLAGTYGVKGWLHLRSYTEPAENLLGYQPWQLQLTTGKRWLTLPVEACRAHKQAFVVKFAGLDSPEQARQYSGALVGVAESALPEPDQPDEFYWRDLIGCLVWNRSQSCLGEVKQVIQTGANDVICITPPANETAGGQRGQTDLLIPFVEQYVLDVDLAQRRIVVDWQLDW